MFIFLFAFIFYFKCIVGLKNSQFIEYLHCENKRMEKIELNERNRVYAACKCVIFSKRLKFEFYTLTYFR